MIKMEGMEQLVRKLEEMGAKGNMIRDKAVDKGADYLVEKVKDNAPKRTGTLKESITKSGVKDGKVDVGPNDKGFHGLFLEFGTTKMSAQPFLTPTFENEIKNIEKKMAEEVKRGLGL